MKSAGVQANKRETGDKASCPGEATKATHFVGHFVVNLVSCLNLWIFNNLFVMDVVNRRSNT